MNRYKLVKGLDNIIWVPIQPLMEDIKDSCHKLENISKETFDSMNDNDKEIFMLKIKGLDTIYTFLGSLMMEYALQNMTDEQKAQHNINEEIEKATRVAQQHVKIDTTWH